MVEIANKGAAAPNNPASKATPPSGVATVVVGCRLLHGIGLQLFQLSETDDKQPIRKPVGEKVWLNGANKSGLINGVGLTEVDASFWEAWVKDNADFAPFKNGHIFVQSTKERALSAADERKTLKTGVEPIDPNNPGERLKTAKIEKMTEKAA
jgi:hypothetical protein